MVETNQATQDQFKPAIARRALLMVLVPALLSSGLLLYLNKQWANESLIAWQQNKNYESVAHEFFNMEHAKEITMGARRGAPIEIVHQENVLAKAELKLLKQTARESGASQKTLDLIEKLDQAQSKTLTDLYDKSPQLMLDHFRHKDLKLSDLLAVSKVISSGTSVAEVGEALDESMDEDVANKKLQQDEARQRVKWTTVVLAFCIFAIALTLLIRFSSAVLRRLNTVIINAHLVGGRNEVLNTLPGNDELSYLNSILLGADLELKVAEEHRKALMEMVAHDMRSPLMASQVSLEIVEKQSELLPEKFKQGLLMAQKNLKRVLQFIEELLSIEKLEAGDIELTFCRYQINEAVEDCINSLEELAGKRKVTLSNLCTPIEILADKRRIEQVLTNFISNAIKFSPEHSEVQILNDTIHDQVRIYVKDQGRGMSKASCRKVFDRYCQTAEGRQKQGYGLGLAICRLLVQAHGGQVGADSEPGEGSTFWLRLPLSKQDGAAAGESAPVDYLKSKVAAFKTREHAFDFRHPRMLEKILLCAVPPLLFEACMLGWISHGILETENLSNKARDNYFAMHCLNYTISLLSVGDMRLLRYFMTEHTKDRDLALQDFAKVHAKLTEFQSHKPADQTAENALKTCMSTLGLLTKLEQLAKNPGAERFDNIHEVSALMSEQNREISFEKQEQLTRRDLLLNQQELLKLSEEELAKRTSVQSQIYIGMAANLVFATIVIVVFGLSITRRLNVLVEHARMLPKKEPVEATVSGDDELAYLDTVLEGTSSRLIESLEHRRAVMQMVAHDMRSPLMAAQASIELLNAVHGESLPAVGRRHLPAAEKNIDRILHLVNDLLTLDKLEAGRLELELAPCNIRQLTDEAIATVGGLATKEGISLLNECQAIEIEADAARLNQVLSNLISNAVKFSARDTTVRIISRTKPNSVDIGVRDNGPGMDAQTAAHVFEKFFQSEGEKKSQGFGLGLAICKLIAESHGGAVSVDTEQGKGSTFWISLPSQKQQAVTHLHATGADRQA
ncbi:MAG: HAMP domain-containing histidine kinase [Candidatus Melainabacteria bacterium]|nr:MAG: HAMP domain-containing histidine kinase [Candidatus Melainabacteria bacterium]